MKNLIPLFLILFLVAPISAKEWTIDNLTTKAVVFPDGTIQFSETRTYRFDGNYSRAEYDIRKRGFDRLYDIQMLMDGVPMTESDSKDPGTFRVRDRRTRITIEWRYEAKDETKVFEVRYTLSGAIVKGLQHSELFWSFIGTRWDRNTLNSDIRVDFANSDSTVTLPIWVDGGVDELRSESGENGRLEVLTGRVPRRDGLRIRTVFPSSWIPNAPVTDPSYTLDVAIADELRKDGEDAIDTQTDAALADFFRGLLPILVLGPLLVFAYFFYRFGRRFTPSVLIPETGHTPPSDLPPAIVSWMLMSRHIYPQAMVATLLDLARRGFITMTSEDEPQRFGKPKTVTSLALTDVSVSEADLQDYELTLYRHIESHALQGPVRLPDLFPPNNSATMKWYMAWAKLTKANAEARGYYDKESTRGVAFSSIVCFLLMVGSIFAAIYVGTLGVLGLISGVFFFIASFFIYRRSESGEIIHRLWLAYRNGLKSGNKADLSDASVGLHLVYAVAFGFAGKTLTHILDQMNRDANTEPWLTTSGFAYNPALFSSQISGMVTSASAGVSAGSGASAGSAGGGGGGGAS